VQLIVIYRDGSRFILFAKRSEVFVPASAEEVACSSVMLAASPSQSVAYRLLTSPRRKAYQPPRL
jgi:hypothetical protein